MDHPHFVSKNESVTILGKEAEAVSFLFILLELIFCKQKSRISQYQLFICVIY
jgi:hypothetical protein